MEKRDFESAEEDVEEVSWRGGVDVDEGFSA